MASGNFDERALSGGDERFQAAVEALFSTFAFDFVAFGLTAFAGAPLKWVYSCGATSERYKRISLAPGHGIGGIVLKEGKPMLYADIDAEMDPREFSSYPIVFAEDLRSFCALPLCRGDLVVGVLLLAFRSSGAQNVAAFNECIESLCGVFCDLRVVSDAFLGFEQLAADREAVSRDLFLGSSDLASVIGAQEEERLRISRELHDGIAQELLTVSMQIDLAKKDAPEGAAKMLDRARDGITGVLEEIHNLSVNLRPSTLDHFGLMAALRSQALVYEKTYGAQISIGGNLGSGRFDAALETQVYRIVQEAIANACKYSESERVEAIVNVAGGWVDATVTDWGGGFNVGNPEIRGSGCGLKGMRERAAIIGATLSVSSDSAGTVVELVAPMGRAGAEKTKEVER